MNDSSEEPSALRAAAGDPAGDAAEVASAGRSCLVILILGVAVVLILCVGLAARWATT